MHLDYFSHLVNAAQAAGVLRLIQSIYAGDANDIDSIDGWLERQARLAQIHGARANAEVAVVALADFCKRNNLDASTSPLFGTIEHQHFYFAEFERGRVMVCEELTPAVIYAAQAKAHVLRWQGWEVSVGEAEEMTDAYGLPTYDRPLLLVSAAGKEVRLTLGGEPAKRARHAYALMAGHEYAGEDSLPDDPRHPYDL